MRRLAVLLGIAIAVTALAQFEPPESAASGGATGAAYLVTPFVDAGVVRTPIGQIDDLRAGAVDAGTLYVSGGMTVIGPARATGQLESTTRIVSSGEITATTYLRSNGNQYRGDHNTEQIASGSAPTLSGFGTSPSVTAYSGSWAFEINVGTGGAASTGTVTFPTNATGWNCACSDITNTDSFVTVQNGGSTTTCTLKNYSRTTGLAIAWTASDKLRCIAFGF